MEGQIVGYADRRSAVCGDTVGVSLSGPRTAVQLEAYRMGAYRDAVARLIWRSGQVAVQPLPAPPLQPRTQLREATWPVSVRVPIAADWPPGFYLLVARTSRGIAGPALPLVVRADADQAPALFIASTLTWNAYNEWGDYSLYRGPGQTSAIRFANRARIASFRRPLTGAGYQQLLYMDLPVVHELEQSGLDVAYTTDVDVDRSPSQLLRHAELVFGGHSEYWTRREYNALAVARQSGVNLIFLGANNLWWHTRLDSSAGSPEPDREIVYRVSSGDPTPSTSLGDLTLLWSQWPEHRDPAAMLGQSHAGIDVHGGYQLLAAPPWLLAGTELRSGTTTAPGSVLPMAVGNEADGYNPLANNPRNLTVVAAGVLNGAKGPVTVSASYYVAPSGAAVFAAGTTNWACGLQGNCFDQRVPPATAVWLRQLTRNLLLTFSQPRAGSTHPPTPEILPSAADLVTTLDPAAVGTYGGSDDSDEGAVSTNLEVQSPSSESQQR
jgi:hypothetical protein